MAVLGTADAASEAGDQRQSPVAFAMRIGGHSLIPLDTAAYIGRSPSAPRVAGPRAPRLVMVPSPSQEISSTHVRIAQEAETVVITDLGSTNGTTVTVGGRSPQTLRQGESLVVSAQAVVDIGEGIRIVIVSVTNELATEGAQ